MYFGFEELFNPEILRRGKEYYRRGAVGSISRKGDITESTVSGSEDYRVAVRFNESGVDELYCECPHASGGRNCKHMAAFLYALCDVNFSQKL